jgi:hypothetical protein
MCRFAVGFWVFGWDDGGAGDLVVGLEIPTPEPSSRMLTTLTAADATGA